MSKRSSARSEASRPARSEPKASEDRTGLGQGMITGANTNVRYRGILFHVQTEDSGRANPHIISHVYHGGTILGTHKTDYSDRLDADDLTSVVRGLIEQQHAAMLAKLDSGGFDAVIAQRLGSSALDADTAAGPAMTSRPDTQPDSRPQPSAPEPITA
ncbi:MAG: hypothetical protein ACREI7_09795, partial [Myxococcota bacterium]